MLTLTAEDIPADIQAYQTRINQATAALAKLPDSTYGWKAETELNKKRRSLLADINHVESLLRYAEEAKAGLSHYNAQGVPGA